MNKGRKYRTERERHNAIEFNGNRNMRGEMYTKVVNRSHFSPVRRTTFYKLAYNKTKDCYFLEDLKTQCSINLDKNFVKNEELAMVSTKEFNIISKKCFND